MPPPPSHVAVSALHMRWSAEVESAVTPLRVTKQARSDAAGAGIGEAEVGPNPQLRVEYSGDCAIAHASVKGELQPDVAHAATSEVL